MGESSYMAANQCLVSFHGVKVPLIDIQIPMIRTHTYTIPPRYTAKYVDYHIQRRKVREEKLLFG